MTDLNTMFKTEFELDEMMDKLADDVQFQMTTYGYKFKKDGEVGDTPINLDENYVDILKQVITETFNVIKIVEE